MVLIAKIVDTESTVILFKLPESMRDPSKPIDKNNVFMICPLHILQTNTHKLQLQIMGNQGTLIYGTIFVTVVVFHVQHTLLDIAMGIVEEPSVINKTFNDIVYASFNPVYDISVINKPVNIIWANETGFVNNIITTIKDMNFTFSARNNTFSIPHPGGYILLNEEASVGMSGRVVMIDNNIIGIIIASSQPNEVKSNESTHNCSCNQPRTFALAVDMYYVLPYIYQCVEVIDKFTYNNPQNLTKLCTYTIMNTLNDDLMQQVNHLGADYTFEQIYGNNLQKHIVLLNIHQYLDVATLQ
jgi:hypothetical protein